MKRRASSLGSLLGSMFGSWIENQVKENERGEYKRQSRDSSPISLDFGEKKMIS